MQIMWKMEMNEIQKKCNRQVLNTGQAGHKSAKQINQKVHTQGIEPRSQGYKAHSTIKFQTYACQDRTEVYEVNGALQVKRIVWSKGNQMDFQNVHARESN